MSIKYLNFPSSIFCRTKLRAKLSFAALFSLSRTRSNFSSITSAVRLLTTKLNTLCLPFVFQNQTRNVNTTVTLLPSFYHLLLPKDFAYPPSLHSRFFCYVKTLFVVSQAIKTWKLNAAFFTRVIVFGSCCTVFLSNAIFQVSLRGC